MKRVIDLSAAEAKSHFLKGSSYFNGDFPNYISFEKILDSVNDVLGDKTINEFKDKNPSRYPGVNYSFVANKDGRFTWRPYELMHPAIYVSLVNLICDTENWQIIKEAFSRNGSGAVKCCSIPIVSEDHQTDKATQIRNWWQEVEQESMCYSLDFSHILHTDVTDCYGSLYTHSISWAIHGMTKAKEMKNEKSLLGNAIDIHIQSGRYGQTNGISQGSVLMDFIAELVLSYVDGLISSEIDNGTDVKILRYRDDYRIFSNSDFIAEQTLKTVSDKLRVVGMKLGPSKTYMNTNVIEGSIKSDKLAGIDLNDLGETNAKTIQKQLLRLHTFGRRFPNSGALRRLVSELHNKISNQKITTDDITVQVAIATDISVVSPLTFPAIAAILSHLISIAPISDKRELWSKVHRKMSRVPYNGYLEIWLQRVTKPISVGIEFPSKEPICQIVNGNNHNLWENAWISNKMLKSALSTSKIVLADAANAPETIQPTEIQLFQNNAWMY